MFVDVWDSCHVLVTLAIVARLACGYKVAHVVCPPVGFGDDVIYLGGIVATVDTDVTVAFEYC